MRLKNIKITILIINIVFYITMPIALLGSDINIQNEYTINDSENTIAINEKLKEDIRDNTNNETNDKIDDKIDDSKLIDEREIIDYKNNEEISIDEQNSQENINLTKSFKAEITNGTKTIENGIYKISTKINEKLVLDVDGGYTKNYANIQLYTDVNVNQQKFVVTYMGDGFYKITALHSEKSLDVAGGGKNPGTNLQQYENNNTDSQKWIIKEADDGYYYIISKCNGLYIDVSGGNGYCGTNIQMYTGNNTISQKFKFDEIVSLKGEHTIENGIYKISTKINEKLVLDVDGGYTKNYANIQLYTDVNVNQQKFVVTYMGDGFYKITALHSEKSLDVAGGGKNPGTNLQQYENNNTDSQKWIIKEADDGYYYIISKCNGLYIDVSGGNGYCGTNIQMYEGNGTLAQKFKLEKTEANYTYNGIDVSEFNGDINWNLVQQTQDFAIIRVGFRGYLRPRIVMDSKFLQNIQEAQSAGIPCGVYFFSQAINEAEAIEEANWVVDSISGYSIKYPIVLDSEWSNSNHNGRADYLTKQERTNVARAFLETIRNRGYTAMLYANPDWLYNYIDISQLSSYDLWLAHYTGSVDNPSSYSGTYTMWQYTSTGSVNGVNGNIDKNICYKKY